MVGDKVKLKIKTYPYEREGIIIHQEKGMCIVEVKYKSGYTMRIKRSRRKLELVKG